MDFSDSFCFLHGAVPPTAAAINACVVGGGCCPVGQAGSSSSLPAWGAQLEDVSFLPWSQPVLAVSPAWIPLLSVHTGGGGELGPMPPSRKSEDPVSPW